MNDKDTIWGLPVEESKDLPEGEFEAGDELVIVARANRTLKERIGRWLVARLVDFEVVENIPEPGTTGKITVDVEVDTSRLDRFMSFFAWTLKPLRWLP